MDKSWEYNHSGVFTTDFNGTIEYWKSLGIAVENPNPVKHWKPEDVHTTIEFEEIPVFDIPEGEPFLHLLYIGDFEMEILHAPLTIPQGEMMSYRQGCNHFCVSVPDIDGETEKLVKKGLRVIQDAKVNGITGEDYLDTREPGHILLSFRSPMTDQIKEVKKTIGVVPWKFYGHTAVVKDLEKTKEAYEYWEIADFEPETMIDTTKMSGVQIYGKPPKKDIKARKMTCQIGDRMKIDFVQCLESDFIYREYLYRRGEGIMDIVFTTKDVAKETAMMTSKGVDCIYSGKDVDGKAFAVFDTREKGGDVLIKLIEE